MARKIKFSSFLFLSRIKRIQHATKKIFFLPERSSVFTMKRKTYFFFLIIKIALQLFVDEILKGPCIHFYDFSNDPSLFSLIDFSST